MVPTINAIFVERNTTLVSCAAVNHRRNVVIELKIVGFYWSVKYRVTITWFIAKRQIIQKSGIWALW